MDLKIGVILGSTRPGRNGAKVFEWLKTVLDDFPNAEYEFIDLKDVELPFLNEPDFPEAQNYQYEYTKRWSEKINPLDGFIIVTPEYNRGAPAVLKNALDYLYKEWNNKPIGFIGYGSNSGTRAVAGLQITSIELQMVPVREQVAIDIWASLDKEGSFHADEATDKRTRKMIRQVIWFARTLKPARQALNGESNAV